MKKNRNQYKKRGVNRRNKQRAENERKQKRWEREGRMRKRGSKTKDKTK
jgi:hypothetical protein